MRTPEDFPACLKRLLAANQISATRLASVLHLKSRNTVFRILNGESSYDKQRDFLRQCRECDASLFTAEQWTQLEEALEVSHIGPYQFIYGQLLERFTFPVEEREADIQLVIHSSGEKTYLRMVLARLMLGRRVRLTLAGGCNPRLMRSLSLALEDPAARAKTELIHYMDPAGLRLVQCVSAILPVVSLPCYQGYILTDESVSNETRALYNANMMVWEQEDAQGKQHRFQLISVDENRMLLYEYHCEADFRFLEGLIRANDACFTPVKAALERPTDPEGCLRYMRQMLELEQGSNLFALSHGVPLSFIHPDLLQGALRDGLAGAGFGTPEQRDGLISQMYEAHLQRWKNIFFGHKVTHTIFSYDAVRHFARTGKLTDQFSAMRPCTRAERRAILTFLRDQLEKNAFFNCYFFKQDRHPTQHEVGVYEGKGVLITLSGTDGRHADMMITQPEFARRMRHYFLHKLLARDVTSQRQTLEMMNELISTT